MSVALDTTARGFQWVIYRDEFVAYVTPQGFQLVAELRARPDSDPYKRFVWHMAKYAHACCSRQLSWGYSDDDARMFARRMLLPRELQERDLGSPAQTALEIGVPISELLDRATWFEPGEIGRGQHADHHLGKRAPRLRLTGAKGDDTGRTGVRGRSSGSGATMPGPMTCDGSKYGAANNRFSRALRDGDLDRAITASRELPRVSLRDAAKLLFLMARNHDSRYARAAARWMSRYAAETRDLTPGMLAEVADALAELEAGNLDAADRLLAAVAGAT